MKYFFIVFCLVAVVIVNVWQNIEVIKIKMEYRKKAALEKKLIKQRDSLIYEIEKLRTVERIGCFAEQNESVKSLQPEDIDVLIVKDKKVNEQSKNNKTIN